MTRVLPALAAVLFVSIAVTACASRGDIETARAAKEDAAKAADDAQCRSTNANPGEPAYEACRRELATKRAAKAEIDYQKARDFDRVLGGLNEY